jgi:hypothetical protein
VPRCTIVLSGPKRAASQVINALTRAGYVPLDGAAGTDAHGLPDTVDGSAATEPQGFVAVAHDDVNGAHETARPFGWRLRAVRSSAADPGPSAEDLLLAKLREMETRLAQLEAVPR